MTISLILDTQTKMAEPQLKNDLFDDVYKEVKLTLTDTYHRFIKLPEVQKISKQSEKFNRMLSDTAASSIDNAIAKLKIRKSLDLRSPQLDTLSPSLSQSSSEITNPSTPAASFNECKKIVE